MKNIIVLIAVSFFLFSSMPAFAKKNVGLDMNEYTCSDLMQEKVEDIPFVLMWVDGYISAETGDLYIDREWIQELAERIFDDCSGNPDVYLVDIVEQIAAE